ncbi:WD40 repeat-like protein [Durotheca rogersii]|uniref:WD40 repeat-like protein n=1 Tax=Durotheca rogersii TaxID=419775 RepID=UPI002220B193|nr:WD40 repeat-like protein [Durotheca rogersii]KAI5861574.1 WD40 repeat-like protein [Durotheca rogersii]
MPHHPPAQPKSVLRGHRAQVHVTAFVRGNRRLASGDADGFVVLWDLAIMRPRAVWRAHANAVLGIADWGHDRIITHGRDNRLIVWKLAQSDEPSMSTVLPLEEPVPDRLQPWVLHILEVNTMNFCSFASCPGSPHTTPDELLIAVPHTLETEAIDIFRLPGQNREHTIRLGSVAEKKGMVMSLGLFWVEEYLTLVAAYESGLAVVARLGRSETWEILYKAQVHSQTVLSLDVDPLRNYFVTSGADATIAKHPIPRVITPAEESRRSKQSVPIIETQPLKIINTKHSGQQGLRIRSDGKILATAGWDSKVRVYSTKTMTELAVLKWHELGCYAVAFSALADGDQPGSGPSKPADENPEGGPATAGNVADGQDTTDMVAVPKLGQLSVKDRRMKMAKEVHWLAAGSKDGKISLWDVY